MACGLTLVLGTTYAAISRFSKRRIKFISAKTSSLQENLLRAQQESFGGIRDVILDNSETIYVNSFSKLDRPFRLLSAEGTFIAQMPRFLIEGIGIASIAISAMILASMRGFSATLPTMGVLILGVQRLLPAVQAIYASVTTIRNYREILGGTIELLEQHVPKIEISRGETLAFKHCIAFKDVYYRYDDANEVVRGLNFQLKKGSSIGVVGTTGSGKSTTIDLLMGLLSPASGQVLIDGIPLEDKDNHVNRKNEWRKRIAHVPQSIYLTDNSIAANIALGVEKNLIDWPRLKQAAVQAQIDEFVRGLDEGYDTYVGERGVRLSGGQRQRIGIARALYKQAEVLVLDEATSALDTSTEQAIIRILSNVHKNLTVIMIAHRLTSVRHCDKILEIDSGRIKAEGSYDQLLLTSPSFRSMVLAAEGALDGN